MYTLCKLGCRDKMLRVYNTYVNTIQFFCSIQWIIDMFLSNCCLLYCLVPTVPSQPLHHSVPYTRFIPLLYLYPCTTVPPADVPHVVWTLHIHSILIICPHCNVLILPASSRFIRIRFCTVFVCLRIEHHHPPKHISQSDKPFPLL
jgi:hypothetical protein